MALKRTIDRRRRSHKSPPPPANSSDDSSIDLPRPKAAAAPPVQDCDSSDDHNPSPKAGKQIESPVFKYESESSEHVPPVQDSRKDELHKKKESVAASVKKKIPVLRATAPKKTPLKKPGTKSQPKMTRAKMKPGKKSQPKTKPAKRKKAPSGDSESGVDSDRDDDFNASESEPDSEEEVKPMAASAKKRKTVRATAPKRKSLKPGKKSHPKTKRAKMTKAPSGDLESDEDSDSGDDSNASEFEPDSEEEEESGESDASWGNDEGFEKNKGRATKTARGRRKSRRGRVQSDESEASWMSDHDDESETKLKTSSRGRSSNRRQALVDSPSDNEENECPRKTTPSRQAANRALDRIHKLEIDQNDDDDDIGPIFSSRKKKFDDDEEFDPTTGDELEDEPDDDDLEEEPSISSAVDEDENDDSGNVDAVQDFLTADSSDDENATGPSPMLDIKLTPRRRKMVLEEASSDSSDDELQRQPSLSSSPHMPDCPSKFDAVTMDLLPDKHICYFPPDQQTRHCFSLETLHKIALSSSILKDGRPAFLQPPHFRAPASDDFIDQIASRFGRAALDLGGDFYSRGKDDQSDYAYLVNFGENLNDDDAFQDHLNEYISRLMGSQDIYCCPLCYIESHRRLANLMSGVEDQSDEDSETDDSIVKLWHDPMTVLGFPDNDKYNIASVFCFTKVADVKRHVREAHNVDTKVLDTNDLFPRFKIRAADGLLQRYIEKNFRGHTFQGDMRRYWNLGNNQTYIFLLHLMKYRARLQQQLDAGHDDTGEAAALFGDAQDFYHSFEDRSKQIWDRVSAPYRKATKEELQDFIDEDDEDVEEDAQPHFVFQRDEVDVEKEILESLKRRRMSGGNDSEHSPDDNNIDDASLEDSHPELSDFPGYYSEEDEEDDEWVKKRLPKKLRGAKRIPPNAAKSAPVIGKRLGSGNKKGGLKRDTSMSPTFVKTSKRNHHAIIDSDSD